ncbi:MAG: HEPN domain-containing protein [Gemmatimonadetes bacterium]|nr:HEPN domain-containing protein [Gemmatimonadota bacterium]
MPNRAQDWLAQARRDLDAARHVAAGGFHEWACFAAQQAAEKATKALVDALNGEARGHAIVAIAASLPDRVRFSDELLDAARRLDRLYIPTRYPNGFDRGAPRDYFTAADSRQAMADAETILEFCARHVS